MDRGPPRDLTARGLPAQGRSHGTPGTTDWRPRPLDCKEIQPVHSNGDQSWVFIGRTDVEAETPILWPPDAKS